MAQGKVLIAEDEKPLAHALTLKLQHEDFEVVSVGNGRDCMQELEKNYYDVLLLDIIMPDMDGFQTLERLRGWEIKPRIFIVSNLSQQEDVDRALSLGAEKFYVKANTSLATIVDDIKNSKN